MKLTFQLSLIAAMAFFAVPEAFNAKPHERHGQHNFRKDRGVNSAVSFT